MKVSYDESANSIHIRLNDDKHISRTEVSDDMVVSFNADGRPSRILLMRVSGYVPQPSVIEQTIYDATPKYVTIQEMAKMHDVDEHTIRRQLWDGKIEGAIKEGSERRGTWYIPREVAEEWQPDPRGRKKATS